MRKAVSLPSFCAGDMQSKPPIKPLCIDCDGTLLRTDLLHESLLRLLLRRPWMLVALLSWFWRGRAYTKARLADITFLNVRALPFRKELLDFIREYKIAGSQIFLVTAANMALASAVAQECGLFDEVLASDSGVNLKGPVKSAALVKRFGHKGFPAISLSHKAATQCAAWIAAKASIDARLPTDAEWKLICAQAKIPADAIEEFAWTNENSPDTTHKCGKKKADALGCFDLYGNAGEWVNDAKNPRMMGGSFQDARTAVGCASELTPSEDWNSSDPQFPKSIWWLADGPFCGFRVVSDSVPVKGT